MLMLQKLLRVKSFCCCLFAVFVSLLCKMTTPDIDLFLLLLFICLFCLLFCISC